MRQPQTFSQLKPIQKEAMGLLSMGTFLEYFDLMLYVHMAVLLNELFFPPTDPHTAKLLSATAFCSTFVFRPFGALIFGWVGDNMGRKTTVILTTMMMAASCFTMANLGTYEEIGASAVIVMLICRVVQGLSSMGEVIGAELYLTELVLPPARYPVVAFIPTSSTLGGMAAIGVATLATKYAFNWRAAFWFGTVIALVGSVARTSLRETPEFVDAKKRLQNKLQSVGMDKSILDNRVMLGAMLGEKVNKKTALSLFLVGCAWPVCFYYVYVHCSNILKATFQCTPAEIIHQNFIVSVIHAVSLSVITYLCYYVHPFKIIRVKFWIFSIAILLSPLLLDNVSSPFQLFLIQSFVVIFGFTGMPASPIYYKSLPVFKRFKYSSLAYAISRAVMHVINAFGMIYIVEYFGNWGLLIILIPVNIAFIMAISHFEELEVAAGRFDRTQWALQRMY